MKKIIQFNKLVRDKIPEIFKNKSVAFNLTQLKGTDYSISTIGRGNKEGNKRFI